MSTPDPISLSQTKRLAANADTITAIPTARQFAFDGRPRPQMRLNFAAFEEQELKDAVRRLGKALTSP